MSVTESQKLFEYTNPTEALEDLCRGIVGDAPVVDQFRPVQPAEMPSASRLLLVHTKHMTTSLEEFYNSSLDLEVQQYFEEGALYRRKIMLSVSGTDHVVEWGVVRLDFRYMDDEVRTEILERGTPLGSVLIKHNVLRRIDPLWFLEFKPPCPLIESFGHQISQPVYGRVGIIYCNEEPAIELLEIVPAD